MRRPPGTHPACYFVNQRAKISFLRSSHRALPYREAAPSGVGQRLFHLRVTFAVPPQLLRPKFPPCRRQTEHPAVMSVPEAAVNENCRTVPREDDIRFSRKLLNIRAVPETPRMQRLSYGHFRPRVLAAHRRHHPASGQPVHVICHRLHLRDNQLRDGHDASARQMLGPSMSAPWSRHFLLWASIPFAEPDVTHRVRLTSRSKARR